MFKFPKKNNEVLDEFAQGEKYYQEGVAKLNDLIAPSAIKVTPRYIRVGETLVQTLFVVTYPRYLHSNWFSPIINLDKVFDISITIAPIDTSAALKNLQKR